LTSVFREVFHVIIIYKVSELCLRCQKLQCYVVGRSLSALGSSQIIMNPDTPEAHRLRGWYDEVGTSANYSEYQKSGDSGNSGNTI